MEKELECKVFTDDFNALMDKAIEMGAKMTVSYTHLRAHETN